MPPRRVRRALVPIAACVASCLAVFVLIGCASGRPPATASPPSSLDASSPTPPPTQVPTFAGGATLTATGSGTVSCRFFEHGCLPSLVIEPAPWAPPADWEPSDGDPYFPTQRQDRQIVVSGAAIGAPAELTPGSYVVALAVSEISDVVSDPEPYLSSEIICSAELTVAAHTISVAIEAVFGDPCSIAIVTEP